MPLKRTPFFEVHTSLGAKLVEFGGFEMPVQYTGILDEHRRVREHVGVFDVSHMGEIEVWGREALAFVQKVTTNDASKLTEGKVQYSAMCYDDGGIVDDMLVYHMGDHYMLVVNASNTAKDHEWLNRHVEGDVRLKNVSDSVALIAIQGPHSLATLQKVTTEDLSPLRYYHWCHSTVAGIKAVVSQTGYTGELGYEIYFSAEPALAKQLWVAIMDAGKEFQIGPVGLGARDTLRLEMGYCLYGHDIDQSTHPLEAGLGWITKMEKGDFVGRNALWRAKEAGLKRKLVGFMLDEKAFPRQGYELHVSGSVVGAVTSGTFSPSLAKGVGMGYIQIEHASVGTAIAVAVRGRELPGTIVRVPFVRK